MVDKNQVKIEAKQIMDNFMNALKDIDVEDEFLLERDECFRDEDEKDYNNVNLEEFKQRFLSNAVKTKGNAIIANKGKWEE